MKSNRVILTCLMIALVSCAKSEDKKSMTIPDTHEVQDLNQNISGFEDHSDDKDISKNPGYRKERFTHGCILSKNEEGELLVSGPVHAMDLDVRDGDSVIRSFASNTQFDHSTMVTKQTVKSIDKSQVSFSQKIISLKVDEAGGEVLTGQPEGEGHCAYSSTDATAPLKCENPDFSDGSRYLNQKGIEFMRRKKDNSIQCSLSRVSQSSTQVLAGTFKMADGKTVNAFKTMSTLEGTVVCDHVDMGAGSSISVQISSNDVLPIVDSNSCGGEMLVYGESIKLGDKVIQSTRGDLLETKLR